MKYLISQIKFVEPVLSIKHGKNLLIGKPPKFINRFRPIALANTLPKLLEEIACDKLYCLLGKNNTLGVRQCGFLRGRYTDNNLKGLETIIVEAFRKKRKLKGVVLDLVCAFDRPWGRHIPEALRKNLGIDDNMLNNTQNMLDN